MARKSPSGHTLAFLIFQHRLKRACDAAWHALCCQEYAKRWWKSVPLADVPAQISAHPDDRRHPFGAIDMSPADFCSYGDQLRDSHIEGAIIACVTSFECYVSDLLTRCIYLNPKLISDSDLQFDAKELVTDRALDSPTRWIAQEYVRRTVRNKSHSKMIDRFGSVLKRNVKRANPDAYGDWKRYVSLRNALIHQAGSMNRNLVGAWPARFKEPGSPIVLSSSDIAGVHKTATSLARTIDKFALTQVIQSHDAELLGRELYVSLGIDEPSTLAKEVRRLLGQKFSKNQAEAAVAKQNRLETDPMIEFALRGEWLRKPHEQL